MASIRLPGDIYTSIRSKGMANSSPIFAPDDTRGPWILALSWITDALAVLAVALRINLRIKAQAVGWNDYSICLALVRLPSALSRMG